MIKFEKVRYKNFLSTGNQFTEIDLNDTKTTLVIGTNGAGKSTFMDAISYGLFGKPFRKINIGQLVNSLNKKNCAVEVEFETSGKKYLVKRSLKPNKFEIWINGELKDQSAAIKDQQEFLERFVLKMNEKSFRQIVILGSGSFVPFMRLPAGDRRSIIEELLDIQIFSTMNDLMKTRTVSAKSELNDLKHEVMKLEDRVEIQQKHLKSIQASAHDEIEIAKVEISKSHDAIKTLQEEIEILQETIADHGTSSKKKQTLDGYKNVFNTKHKTLKNQLHAINTLSECPTCAQSIEEEYRDRVSSELLSSCKEHETALNQVCSQLDLVGSRLNEITSTLGTITTKQNSIANHNHYLDRLHNEMDTKLAKIESPLNNGDLSESMIALETARESKYNVMESLHDHNTVTELLKDGGIKTVIIRNYLPVINQLINKYLAELNFYINFELDENFNETIKSRGRDKFAYASFSEGEKMRIDLALLFTWREVSRIKSSVSTNLLILDEIFDGSLDNNGIDDFLGILNSLEEDTNTFVISHKGGQIIDKFGKVVKVEKVKQFSKIAKS